MRPRSLRIIPMGLIVAAVAAVLSGCATSSTATRGEAAALPGRPACFRVADFDGSWVTLNDSELIVPDPIFSRWYLLELGEPVYDLRLRHRLGFEPFTPANGCICNGFSDYLLAVHAGRAGHVPIAAVRELTEPEARRLSSKYHVKLPAWPSAPVPSHQGNGCPIP